MKEEYEKEVIRALSEITNTPENQIDLFTLLNELSEKIKTDIEGLLGRLCMKIGKRVSSNDSPAVVRDILINEIPYFWRG